MKLVKIEAIIIAGLVSLAVLLFGSWFLKYYMETANVFSAIGGCTIVILLMLLRNIYVTRRGMKPNVVNGTTRLTNAACYFPRLNPELLSEFANPPRF